MARYRTNLLVCLSVLALVLACGLFRKKKTGSSSSDSSTTTTTTTTPSLSDVSGSIGSVSGDESELNQWIIALLDRQMQIARVSVIDASGSYTFKQVPMDSTYTLYLFSPTFVLRSVLAHPSDTSGKLLQYFQLKNTAIPLVIYRGSVLNIDDDQNLTWYTKKKAKDSVGDGVPDGVRSLGLVGNATALRLLANSNHDVDADGVPNAQDSDICGVGLLNAFNSDDDCDGVPDIFDPDANGDGVPDVQETIGDLYFQKGMQWIMVRYQIIPQSDGSNQSQLVFTANLRQQQDQTPIGVKIRGSSDLLKGAVVVQTDTSGHTTTSTWDGTLADDGKNDDFAAKDGIYGRRIILASGKTPLANQTLFFQLEFGTAASPWYMEFPYTFANVTPTAITSSWDATTNIVTFSGTPYGTEQGFHWVVVVSAVASSGPNITVFTSPAISGKTTTYTIPDNVIQSGQSYKYEVRAQTLDRIPGFPPYSISTGVQTVPSPP